MAKELKLSLEVDFQIIDRMLPTVDWAVETNLLTEQEALKAVADEVVRTICVKEKV